MTAVAEPEDYGFVVDYLAEALRELRKHNFTEVIDRHFSLCRAPQRPRREGGPQDGLGACQAALPAWGNLQGRAGGTGRAGAGRPARVKEQLKKMGSFEYHQTSFSYLDSETREERFVGVPEQGGRDMIAAIGHGFGVL